MLKDIGFKEEINFFFKGEFIMPCRDGTGPMGKGPMTGRAEGYCVLASPENSNFQRDSRFDFFGRGRGFGGGGRGRRNRFASGLPGWARASYSAPFDAGVTEQQELNALKNQAKYFQDALDGIKKSIEELEQR